VDKYLLAVLKNSYKGACSGRDDEDIHASDLDSFCARAYRLCVDNKIPFHKKRYLAIRESVTYDIGTALHNIVRKRLHRAGVLVGGWQCIICQPRLAFGILPLKCPVCKSQSITYKEPNVRIKCGKYWLVGNIDGIVAQTSKDNFILEIKSISADQYDSLTKPLIDHETRVNTYLWMLDEERKTGVAREVRTDAGVLLYIAKGMKPMPFKTFLIEKDPKAGDRIKEKLSQLKSKTLPKKICKGRGDMMARSCHVAEECFK